MTENNKSNNCESKNPLSSGARLTLNFQVIGALRAKLRRTVGAHDAGELIERTLDEWAEILNHADNHPIAIEIGWYDVKIKTQGHLYLLDWTSLPFDLDNDNRVPYVLCFYDLLSRKMARDRGLNGPIAWLTYEASSASSIVSSNPLSALCALDEPFFTVCENRILLDKVVIKGRNLDSYFQAWSPMQDWLQVREELGTANLLRRQLYSESDYARKVMFGVPPKQFPIDPALNTSITLEFIARGLVPLVQELVRIRLVLWFISCLLVFILIKLII